MSVRPFTYRAEKAGWPCGLQHWDGCGPAAGEAVHVDATCLEGNREIPQSFDLEFYFWDCNIPVQCIYKCASQKYGYTMRWYVTVRKDQVHSFIMLVWDDVQDIFVGTQQGMEELVICFCLHSKHTFIAKNYILIYHYQSYVYSLLKVRVPKGLSKTLRSSFLISASQKSFSSILHYLPSYFKMTCLYQYCLIALIFTVSPVDFLQWKRVIRCYHAAPFETHTHTFPSSPPFSIVQLNFS